MRHMKYILAMCLMCLATMASAKGNVKKTVYMFGMSASFNDSTIYFTPIQQVEGYITNDRYHFLVSREEYSYQLRNYFDNRGQTHRTCITFYSTNKKKADKQYERIKNKYTKKSKNKFDIVYLADDDFAFKTVTPEEGVEYVDPQKAEQDAEKKGKKGKKKGRPDMPGGPGAPGGAPMERR